MIDRWSSIADLAETGADIPDGGRSALDRMPHEDEIRRALVRMVRDCKTVMAAVKDLRSRLRTAGFDDAVGSWVIDGDGLFAWMSKMDPDAEVSTLSRQWNGAKPEDYCPECGTSKLKYSYDYVNDRKADVCYKCRKGEA